MSTGNNTNVPLVAGGVFTGPWEKRVDLAILSVSFYTNKDSSLVVEQSTNGATAVNSQTFNYTAGPSTIFQQYLVLEYFRIIVTNTSAQSQAYLRVSSRLSNVVAPFAGDFSGAVSVTNFPETQAVSIADPVPVTGDFYQATQPISGSVSVNNLQDVSGVTVLADISGQTVLVGNFPATQPVQMLGSLTQTNTAYYDAAVEAIISLIGVTDGYLYIQFDGPTAFTNGQSVVLTQINAFPQLNGRVYQIFYQVGDGTTLVISTPDLANVGLTASTGVAQSVRVTPLVCNELGALLVDISGQDVHVNNLQDISGVTVVTDISGQTLLVGNFPATQPVSGSVSLLAAADPTTCVGTVRMTDVYGDPITTTSGLLMCGIGNIFTSNPLHTIMDSATGTTYAYRNIALSNTGQVVSAVPATIRQFSAQNSNATGQFFKIYNKSTAATSSDTPIFTYFLPSGGGVSFELNHAFSVGVSVRATFLPADNDNTAAANYVFTNFTYSV